MIYMKILFITQKWASFRPDSALSLTQNYFVNTLLGTKYESGFVYSDEIIHNGGSLDQAVLQRCELDRPHAIVFDYMHKQNCNLSSTAVLQLKKNGIKIASIWCDTQTPDGSPWDLFNDSYANMMDLNVVLDMNVDGRGEKFINLFSPQDPKVYYGNPLSERSWVVSFVGDTSRGNTRHDILSKLKRDSRIKSNIIHTQQHSNNRFTQQQYTDILRTSQMSINIGGGSAKGRPFEICLCGSMCLSDTNDVIDKFLVPGEDYIVFNNYEDLVSKCVYYRDNPDARLKISSNGYNKVSSKCNHNVFWDTILNGLRLI